MRSICLLRTIILACIVFASSGVKAQMVATDVFLKGQYVELGIGNLGFYGSAGSAPTGYHPHAGIGSSNLGFVADPAMDGWAMGTPAYTGDYFVPGSPFEGWELQVNGKRALAYNSGSSTTAFKYGGGMSPCTGANTAYTLVGSVLTGTWVGMVDSIIVQQETILDTNNAYFNVKVTLTNTSYLPKTDVYYFRTLDPDNDETWPGGSFSTDNLIEHQAIDTNVVSATGASSPLQYLALGTTDTNATAVIYSSWPTATSLDLATIYNKTYFAQYAQGVHDPGDLAIGLIRYIPYLASVDSASDSTFRTTSTTHKHPKNTATLSFFYAFSGAAVDSAIVAGNKPLLVKPPSTSLGINNVNSTNESSVYPNPSKDMINVTGLNTTDEVSMYDMMGRQIVNNWTINNTGLNKFSIKNVPSGSYVIMVKDAGGNTKAKLPLRKL